MNLDSRPVERSCKTNGDEEGSEEEEEEDQEVEHGMRRTVKKLDPKTPSRGEVDEHNMTHIPFRNWCRHCVRGRGKEEACKRREKELDGYEVHMDFMFMGDEGSEKTLAMLVVKERMTKAVMACVAPRKSSGQWLVGRVMAFLREVGCEVEKMTMKTDNEPALVKVVEEVGRLRAAKGGRGMVVEHSPVHSSKSNGFIERAVQSVQGLIRTWRSAVEEKWGVKLETEHVIWPWLVEAVAWTMTRTEVGMDGKTAYERCRGKKARVQGLEFGEGVLWKRRREGGPLGKLTCMWEDGVYLGMKGSTGETIIGDKNGIWRTRTTRRKPIEERWSRTSLEMIGGVPWKMTKDSEGDGEDLGTEVRIMDKDYKERIRDEDYEVVPRKMYITIDDLEKHGYTERCPGCIAILRGTARQAHTKDCRNRMEEKLKTTEKAMKAKKRVDEYVEKKAAEEEEVRRRIEKKRRKREGDGGTEDKNDERMDEDDRKGAESSQSSRRKRHADEQADVETTMKYMRKLERDERKKRAREIEADDAMVEQVFEEDGEKKVYGYVVNEEVLEIEDDGGEWELPEELDPRLVKEGRGEEVEFMVKKLDMFEFGTLEEAMRRGGKRPTTTKWVEGWKIGEDSKRFVRSRLVARDFKMKFEGDRHDLFAAMPPLEAKKTLFRMTAGERGCRRRRGLDETKLMFIDVKKAHLNAICDEEEWVELPEELWKWGRYARLRRWLYGMRKAASGWEEDYSKRLEAEGFRRGKAAPTLFWNPRTGVKVVVHGDDFTMSGVKGELEAMRRKMAEWYDIKDRGIMGSAGDEIKEVKILGRTVRWTKTGIEYEADQSHRRELMKRMGLDEKSKAAVSAAVKVNEEDAAAECVGLEGDDKKEFRGEAALLSYLGQDRPDLQFATNQICRCMARPTEAGRRKVKRAVRYLVGAEKVIWHFGEFEDEGKRYVDVHVDSDWAGGVDRKSVSGGMLMVAGAAVKHWSRTQKTRAMSSAEAEFYGLVSGCAEGLGVQAMAADLGEELAVRVWTDSTAGRAVAGRKGLGKLRHLETKYLWVQDLVRSGRLEVRRVSGERNLADHLTKPKGVNDMAEKIAEAGGKVVMKMAA